MPLIHRSLAIAACSASLLAGTAFAGSPSQIFSATDGSPMTSDQINAPNSSNTNNSYSDISAANSNSNQSASNRAYFPVNPMDQIPEVGVSDGNPTADQVSPMTSTLQARNYDEIRSSSAAPDRVRGNEDPMLLGVTDGNPNTDQVSPITSSIHKGMRQMPGTVDDNADTNPVTHTGTDGAPDQS